ncbi:MAG: 23S rRNA (guanosine(2251)-2'-O)-methyltransferase RlmB [Deltaproteobacteria bacterium]|nr:23S rRNA (guanosine(2251)-2'-O)-methyltransferase RlmB [Deltaproteobacteria bacterium]
MRIIYGINPVSEALKSHPEYFKDILIARGKGDQASEKIKKLAEQHGIKCRIVEKGEIERLAQTSHHQGVIGIIAEFKYVDIEDILESWKSSGEKAFILILDCIQDPQNLGSLIRTANAAGAHGVIIPKDRAAEVTAAVVKASAGAIEHMLISRVTNIADTILKLKEAGLWIIGIEAGGNQDIYSFDMNTDLAIVIGSEGKGIRRLVKERCDVCLSIPMKGSISSLNASVAGGIALFEVVRRRRGLPHR